MVRRTGLALTSIVAAALLLGASAFDDEVATTVLSAPSYWQPSSEFVTGISLDVAGTSQSDCASKFAKEKVQAIATAAGVPASDVQKTSEYRDQHNGLLHATFRQVVNGVPVENGHIKVAVDKDNRVVAWSSTMKDTARATTAGDSLTDTQLTAVEALQSFARAANLPFNAEAVQATPGDNVVDDVPLDWKISGVEFALGDVPVNMKYYVTAQGVPKLSWSMEVEMLNSWLNVFVDAESGEILGFSDWSSNTEAPRFTEEGTTSGSMILEYPAKKDSRRHLSTQQILEASLGEQVPARTLRRAQAGVKNVNYRVLPVGINDPEDGPFSLLTDPQDPKFSPLGWHDAGRGPSPSTKGNNVVATANNYAPVADNYNFDYVFDATKEPTTYRNLSVTNMFYMSNMIHDIYYAYGFTPAAGNFQTTNAGEGGAGNDAVVANCQDRSGTNNANFATPPDGRAPTMRMYLWDRTQPGRDGALENDIVIHEYTHGLSNRLTGGPSNSNCLSGQQPGGMGEGWSDFYGNSFRIKPTDSRETDFALGVYVLKNKAGIRKFPYSTNMQTNPLTFSRLATNDYRPVHSAGTVWNTILNEVYWNLVDELGFTADIKNDAQSGKGNTLMMQLVMDGMKLQPCNPTFINARDAIIQAEKVLTGGKYACLLWKGFAKRGLGVSATSSFKDGFDVPADCQ